MSQYADVLQLAGAIERGDPRATAKAIRMLASAFLAGEPYALARNLTISPTNMNFLNGRTVVMGGAYTLTFAPGLVDFGIAVRCPASGNASIASSGGVLLEGATATLTRALVDNPGFFAVSQLGPNSFGVSGG